MEVFSTTWKFVRWFLVGCWNVCKAWSQKLNYFWKLRGNVLLSCVITTWWVTAVFRFDTTELVNELNIKLQGVNRLVTEMFDKITEFLRKLRLCELHLLWNNMTHFPILRKEKETCCSWEIRGRNLPSSSWIRLPLWRYTLVWGRSHFIFNVIWF